MNYFVVKYANHNGERTKFFATKKRNRITWTTDIYKALPLDASCAIDMAEANKLAGAFVPAAFASWSRMSADLLKRAKRLEDNVLAVMRQQ